MPNYVQSVLVIEGHESHLRPFLDFVKSEDEVFDFSKIIPMPVELKGTRSPVEIVSQREYDNWVKKEERRKREDTFFDMGKPLTKTMQKELIDKTGHDNWYDWALQNWGTKWGSMDSRIGDEETVEGKKNYKRVTIYFQTAWSGGHPVLHKLGTEFPTLDFHWRYADEDCGYNTGEYKFSNGEKTLENVPECGSKEAMEIYLDLWNEWDSWELVDGEYRFLEFE
jgi:hypothetical protein